MRRSRMCGRAARFVGRRIGRARNLELVLLAVSLLFFFTPQASAQQIYVGDPYLQVGMSGGAGNQWPAAESPDHAIDGVGQKYLNFGEFNTGFIVQPSAGSSVASSITFTTANDAVERDPVSYRLFGTNAAIDMFSPAGTEIPFADFTEVSFGDLSLPGTRNANATSPLDPANQQTVDFMNSDSYSTYLVVFPTVKDPPSANSMQIGEVTLSSAAGSIFMPDDPILGVQLFDKVPYEVNGAGTIDVNRTERIVATAENVVTGSMTDPTGAVFAQVFDVGNTTAGGTYQGVQDVAANNVPFSEGLMAAPIFWPGSNGGVYPAVFGFEPGVNREEYTVKISGEMLIEEDGEINFKDGVDDFTAFHIDTDGDGTLDEVINDNTWTNEFGVNNGGSPISPATFTNVDAGGEWRAFEFYMAEGGGGDSGALAWDFNDPNGSFPTVQTDPFNANNGDDLVPSTHLRAAGMTTDDATISFDAVLRLAEFAETVAFDVDVEQLEWDKIGMAVPGQIGNNTPDSATLDLEGVAINVNLSADPTPGLTVDLIDNTGITEIVGTPSFTFSHGDPADWDTSQFAITGQLTYGGGPPVGIAGDYNNNGQVEQGDLDLVLLNWGTNLNAPWVTGSVDQEELDGVLLNWGNTAGLGSAGSVPEPSTMVLLLLAAAGALGRGRIGKKLLAAMAVFACVAGLSVQSSLAQIDVGGDGIVRKVFVTGEQLNLVEVEAPDNGLGYLYAERYDSPDFSSWANVESWIAGNDPVTSGFMEAPPFWDSDDLTNRPYPAVLGFPAGVNQEEYGVYITGEILIPDNGFIDFRDGIDDQTVFVVDEDGDGSLDNNIPIIEDTEWTNIDGTDVGGGNYGVGSSPGFGTFTNVEDGGSWRQFVLTMDEGGGGDRISLAWSVGDTDGSFFPAFDPSGGFNINEGDDLVPRENYRFPGAMLPQSFDSVLDYTSGANFEVNVEELEWDRVASNEVLTTADVTYIADFSGGVLTLELSSDPLPGLTVDLVDDSVFIDEIRGPASFAFSHGDMALWDTSNFTTNGQISYAASAAQVLTGDYNGNGRVEQGDLDLVMLNWGQSGSDLPDGWVITAPTGNIDQDELDAVLVNWGAGGGLTTAGVPEPTTIALVLVAAGLSLGLIRKGI